jgi:hypothetical protein
MISSVIFLITICIIYHDESEESTFYLFSFNTVGPVGKIKLCEDFPFYSKIISFLSIIANTVL